MNKIDFLNIENESEFEFREIADRLFNTYAIETYNSIYRIAELEFYWNSKTHEDNSTYQRKYVDPDSGDWFFHYSGVDIALKNKSGAYSGILLRSVYDIKQNKLYKGPMICMMRLFSGTHAFNNTIKTKIIQHSFSKAEIKNSERIGLGSNAIKNDANKFLYRFYINPV